MPLSTSSSDCRVPDLNYRRQWVIVLTLVFVILGSMELFWHMNGFVPSVNDTKDLWSYWRDRIYTENGRKKIVLIGASRLQLGIVPDVLEAELVDYDVVNLAVDGHAGYATFEDVANDPKFNGIVIYSTNVERFARSGFKAQKQWCEYYSHNYDPTLNDRMNFLFGLKLQGAANIFGANSSPKFVADRIISYDWPDPCISMRSDRYRPAFYSKLPVDKLEAILKSRIKFRKDSVSSNSVILLTEFEDVIQTRLTPFVDRINERGGKVVLLNMPQSGEYWKMAEDKYPIDFWNTMERNSDALAVHFQKYPSLSSFNCPDGSHLEYSDAVVFTKELARIMKEELFESKIVGKQ